MTMLVDMLEVVFIKDTKQESYSASKGWTRKEYKIGAYIKNEPADGNDALAGLLRAALFTLGWDAKKIEEKHQ